MPDRGPRGRRRRAAEQRGAGSQGGGPADSLPRAAPRAQTADMAPGTWTSATYVASTMPSGPSSSPPPAATTPAERPAGHGQDDARPALPSILPPLTRTEAIEVTRIHSIAGDSSGSLIERRPFRAPHHSITPRAGRGCTHGLDRRDRVGPPRGAFPRRALGVLTPGAGGATPTARGRADRDRQGSTLRGLPSRFMLLAATNPCPCGYAGELERCSCSEADHARHRAQAQRPPARSYGSP